VKKGEGGEWVQREEGERVAAAVGGTWRWRSLGWRRKKRARGAGGGGGGRGEREKRMEEASLHVLAKTSF